MTRVRARLRRSVTIGPVARAVARQQWTKEGLDAQLHAMIGADARTLSNLAGRMFFVVLGAAISQGFDVEEPDLRIVRGAVNAVYDIADLDAVPDAARAPINSGLEAVQRLAARMTTRALADAYFDLQARLAAGDINCGDFLALERP